MCTDDSSAALAILAQLRGGAQAPEVGLSGGDLHRSLGGPQRGPTELHTGMGVRCPIDILEVHYVDRNGAHHATAAVNSVVVGTGRRFWTGRWTVLMNGTVWGAWDLGPRAHPNDGWIDLTDGTLPRRSRREARRRSVTGSHIPHPDLAQSRVTEWTDANVGRRRVLVDRVEVPDVV
ncbi:MAG: hypothetical protein ACKOYM_03880, partial [Actinomycetes bacterium]